MLLYLFHWSFRPFAHHLNRDIILPYFNVHFLYVPQIMLSYEHSNNSNQHHFDFVVHFLGISFKILRMHSFFNQIRAADSEFFGRTSIKLRMQNKTLHTHNILADSIGNRILII